MMLWHHTLTCRVSYLDVDWSRSHTSGHSSSSPTLLFPIFRSHHGDFGSHLPWRHTTSLFNIRCNTRRELLPEAARSGRLSYLLTSARRHQNPNTRVTPVEVRNWTSIKSPNNYRRLAKNVHLCTTCIIILFVQSKNTTVCSNREF